METELEKVWAVESQRLLTARNRFFDSLAAIKELADFAVAHSDELERNREFHIDVLRKDIEGLTEEESKSARLAVTNLFKSIVSVVRETLPEGTLDNEVSEEVSAQFDKAFEKFNKEVPEGFGDTIINELASPRVSRARTGLLLSSLLIAAVSDFEVLFSASAAFFYRMRPESLRALDSKVSWKEIETYASLDDLRTHFIEERVDSLMRDGYDDWMRWLENQLKIKSEGLALDPRAMYEVIQRRHILVHNGGKEGYAKVSLK